MSLEEAKNDPTRTVLLFAAQGSDRGVDIKKIIKGGNSIFGQYHFTMETQSCVTRPSDDGIEVLSSNQWLDACQVAISDALKIDENR